MGKSVSIVNVTGSADKGTGRYEKSSCSSSLPPSCTGDTGNRGVSSFAYFLERGKHPHRSKRSRCKALMSIKRQIDQKLTEESEQ